jgi:hypothetical protein
MSVIKIQPAKRVDLKVEYAGTEYTLPGSISAAMLESLLDIRDEQGEEQFLKAFLAQVVPADFKKVLDQADLVQLVTVWMEHIQAPKASSSKNSSKTTNQR